MKIQLCVKSAFVGFFLVTPSFLKAEIIEVNTIAEATSSLKPGMVLLFDIDNTVMMPVQTLGGEEWFEFQAERYTRQLIAEGYLFEEAKKKAIGKTLVEWNEIQLKTDSVAVEENIPRVFKKLQKKGVPLMALTARPYDLCERTKSQLESIGIRATQKTIMDGDFEIGEGVTKVRYFQGHLCVGAYNEKGPTLKKFLELLVESPQKIVFLDNKIKHVKGVEDVLSEMRIPYLGVRLGTTDRKIAAFDPKIADVQLEHFRKYKDRPGFRILSDAEAKEYLRD